MTDKNVNGILYLCATPIGNLEDITLRALRILKEVSLIAAEDTRHTRKLLNHFGINNPVTSYHEHNKREKGTKLISELRVGKSIALVSDAGTPGISDPGQDLVALAVSEGIKVVPVPGASAHTAALISSGLPTERFVFEGFLPRTKKNRTKILSLVAQEERTVVFYESPHRVIKTLEEIYKLVGDREAAVTRELTKVHEEVVRGRLSYVVNHFKNKPPRGEFTVVLKGREEENKESLDERDPEEVYAMVSQFIKMGLDKKDAIKEVARTIKTSKNKIYELLLIAEDKK